MARKSLLEAIRLTLDYDQKENILILIRGDPNVQIGNIEPKNRRKKEVFGRKYCPRQAYNLAITLIKEMEKGKYQGYFEITTDALVKLRQYPIDYMIQYNQNRPKPQFETSSIKTIEANIN
jgi:hypothetical protein